MRGDEVASAERESAKDKELSCAKIADHVITERQKRVCQNTLFITEDRYIAELSYKVAI